MVAFRIERVNFGNCFFGPMALPVFYLSTWGNTKRFQKAKSFIMDPKVGGLTQRGLLFSICMSHFYRAKQSIASTTRLDQRHGWQPIQNWLTTTVIITSKLIVMVLLLWLPWMIKTSQNSGYRESWLLNRRGSYSSLTISSSPWWGTPLTGSCLHFATAYWGGVGTKPRLTYQRSSEVPG